MGGRGISFAPSFISIFSPENRAKKAVRIQVIAGMTPADRHQVSAEKTLVELEQKKRSMDKEQLQILDQHGFVTTAYQGDKHSVGVDSHGLQQMQGNIVTHNHPGVYGGTFSDADISTLQCGMRELRASAAEGTYSLKATKEADPHSFYHSLKKEGRRLESQMRQIAAENAERNYSSRKEYVRHNRESQLTVLHDWYKQAAPKYGYSYAFTPSEDT